jgi:SAM-dependent methyltransferase
MSARQDWQSYGGGFLGPPSLSDKLTDWIALADAGGDALIREKHIVDVGPAYGVDAFVFSFYAASYTVLDSYVMALDQVKRVAPKTTIVKCDLRHHWPVRDSAFDTVIDFSTFDDTGNSTHCYHEAARILRPGGTLCTSYANASVCPEGSPYDCRVPDELSELLRSLGLRVHHRSHEHQGRAVMFGTKDL